MLTLFSIPKAFSGRVGDIQRNAVASWVALGSGVQVMLVGDEPGTAEAAAEFGVAHLGGVTTNDRGTPRLDSAFSLVDAVADHRLRCFVNADIILLDDFLLAVEVAVSFSPRVLLVGRTRDLPVGAEAAVASTGGRTDLREQALATGTSRGAAAIDFFVFPAGLFDPMPPFLVGRSCFDNWLVWKGRQQGPVIDATQAVVAVHQRHDYSHLSGGKDEAYYGAEAAHNLALAGGRGHVYTLNDASHKLTRSGAVRRNVGSILRARETLRRIRAKLGLWVAARQRVAH